MSLLISKSTYQEYLFQINHEAYSSTDIFVKVEKNYLKFRYYYWRKFVNDIIQNDSEVHYVDDILLTQYTTQ